MAICANVPPAPVFRSIWDWVSLPLVSCQARLIWLDDAGVAARPPGASGDTEMPDPLTARVVPAAPLKATELLDVPIALGAKRTVTSWLWPIASE